MLRDLQSLLSRLGSLWRSPRALGATAAGFALIAVVFLFLAFRPNRIAIRVSPGDLRGRRAEVARALAQRASQHGLDVEVVASIGSEDALEKVERREIDVALVQGGLEGNPDVREIAPLVLEPLHLLVRRDSEIYGIEDLRGARVQLGPPRSGTRALALEVLELAELEPERDFEEVSFGYRELEELAPEALPDAIFHVSALPSPNASFLVHERGYRLLALPYADAVGLRDVSVSRGTIPAFAYGADPAMPPEEIPTLATRMLLLAHRRTSDEVVRRLLEVADSEEFLLLAQVRRAEQTAALAQPEFALHPGTVAWLHRNDPLLTPEMMEGIESFRSFLVSLVVAGVLAYRLWRRKRLHGLDASLEEVSKIDREALALEREARLDLARLLALRTRLGEAKARALEAFSRGAIHSEELLSSFLTHVSDVRSHLNAMILHERERREKQARARGQDEEQFMSQLWQEALAEEHGDRELVSPPDARSRERRSRKK